MKRQNTGCGWICCMRNRHEVRVGNQAASAPGKAARKLGLLLRLRMLLCVALPGIFQVHGYCVSPYSVTALTLITSCNFTCLLVYFLSPHGNMQLHGAGHKPLLFSVSSGAFRTVYSHHRPPEKNRQMNRLIETELRAKILITES